MYSKKIITAEDLFAKKATLFVQNANDYKCCVWIKKREKQVAAKSLLGVLALGVVCGDEIIISADGTDEVAAVDCLVKLFETRFATNTE